MLPSKSKMGTECKIFDSNFVSKSHPPTGSDEVKKKVEEWIISDGTIILGYNPTSEFYEQKVNKAEWEIELPKISKLKKLASVNLKINTTRTLGGLHFGGNNSTIENKSPMAYIYINDKLIDKIELKRQIDQGSNDFGIRRIDPYPIKPFICDLIRIKKKNPTLKIRIELDPMVYWDIDEISLESMFIEAKRFKSGVVFWANVILSAFLGYMIFKLLDP